MLALPRFALGCALLVAAPSWASGDGVPTSDDALFEIDSPSAAFARSIAERVRLTVPGASEPADVHICEGWTCNLARVHRVPPAHEGGLVLEQHRTAGQQGIYARDTVTASAAARPSSAHGAHPIALLGRFETHAPIAATLTPRTSTDQPFGGVTPYEATELLEGQPHLALAFAAVVVAPAAQPDDDLVRSLKRLVDMGGAVVIPRAWAPLFTAGETEEPLVADPDLMLVQLGSTRVLVEGQRALPATVVRSAGAGVVVLYDADALSESSLSDALLAAVPSFRTAPRVHAVDPRSTQASIVAGMAVSQRSRPTLLLLPLGVALLLVGVALHGRRRRGVFLTPPFVALALLASAALLIVPRVIDSDGANAEVRTYTTLGSARVAFEEGAVAARPSASGGIVTLTTPVGTSPLADARGVLLPGPVQIEVSDGGRTLQFEVHGDGAGVASWARPVSLPEGLVVEMPEGRWPTTVDELSVVNQLPFPLLALTAMLPDGSLVAAAPLAPGQQTSSWERLTGESPSSDGVEPAPLVQRSLLEGMAQRCRSWRTPNRPILCVTGIGFAADGALVGVQVLSP